jgi:type III pantothenate kinase
VSILLIDIGNTRVKWSRLVNGKLRPQRAVAHAGWQAADFASHLFGGAQSIERIVVASVAGTRMNRMLAAAARRRCGLAPQFIKTQRSAAGVTTRYQEPWRLGVDRFAAAIGAHNLLPDRALCVVGVGTAMTIDLVDAHGVHRGGAIVPGPDLMIASLLKSTSGIQRRARGAPAGRTLFARTTRAAIEQGTLHAAASVVDRAFEEARLSLKVQPILILTGGAAPSVRGLVRTPSRIVGDLVLRGLAVLAKQ